jgi:4-carboxymuconolactone decarboxylase
MSDEQYERGKALADKVLGRDGQKRHADIARISPMHARAILEYCYGQVWSQPLIEIKTKLLILIAVCASQGEYDAVARQVRGALNHGAAEKEIIEAITTFAPYIGYPRTNSSLRAAQAVFDAWKDRPEWHSV